MQECINATSLGCNFEEWKATYGVNYTTQESDHYHHLWFCKNCYFIRSNSGSGFTMK